MFKLEKLEVDEFTDRINKYIDELDDESGKVCRILHKDEFSLTRDVVFNENCKDAILDFAYFEVCQRILDAEVKEEEAREEVRVHEIICKS